ncbi:CoA transferase [Sphingobium sp. UBA5915]|uniref:CoA transferase n=1 Tax=Sphingobium sp. UBA5915 TaxID=1947530 RepID=UPI0025D92DC6|nr:CoA transferase [Sphingobium sp. UBA5915]
MTMVQHDAQALAARMRAAASQPASDDRFDIQGELAAMLAELGMTPADGGGAIDFHGLDPLVPSTIRLGGGAALGLVQQSVVAAALHRDRGRPGQDIAIQLSQALRKLAPGFERRWELLNGHMAVLEDPNIMTMLRFYRTADDREVLAANLYPKLKSGMMALLQCWDKPEAVAQAIARHSADELEMMFEAAGLVMAKARTVEEFIAEPVFDYLAARPLIEIEKIADGPPEPLPPAGAMPLSGIRALGMGHVIAGAGAGRSLASLGADVLNIWRPAEFEQETLYLTANVGMRSAKVDPRSDAGRARLRELVGEGDIFFANRRPGLLSEFGLDAATLAQVRPGIVHVTMSTHGEGGPWAQRPGFDQIAGAVTGMLCLEGSPDRVSLPPTIIVNDFLTGWLAATGAMAALRRRASEGGSYRVHVSLTRVAMWLLSLGSFDKAYAKAIAGTDGPHATVNPTLFTVDTPLGRYQGMDEQVRMSATPRAFQTVLVARGSSRPEWMPRD